jgi:hypothetical protein
LAMERCLFSRRAGQARSTGAQLPPNEDPKAERHSSLQPFTIFSFPPP